MDIHVISLFPEAIQTLVTFGIPRIAQQKGALRLHTHNPRDYADNRQRKVDDRPFGGGPGMVMQAEPLQRCLEHIQADTQPKSTIVFLSPQGQPFNQATAAQLAALSSLTLLCGRYEGVDQRLLDQGSVLEVSVGDVVLSGGELPAMMIIDAIARLLPQVLGDAESHQQDSFQDGLLDCPHYSRPEHWRGQGIPEVLMNGNHAHIQRWRLKQALGQTFLKRPDLLHALKLSSLQLTLLNEYLAEQDVSL